MINKVEFNIVDVINEIKNAKTPKMKKEVLEKYKTSITLQNIIYYTYNPYLRYGISMKMFDKYQPTGETPDQKTSLYGLLDELAASNINDSLRLKVVNFVDMFAGDSKEIIKGIFTKDLKLGVSPTTFNKVWPGLIPTFSLQLAARFQNNPLNEGEYIYVTEKFDGIRCVCMIHNGIIKFFTRQGKEITGLKDIENDIKRSGMLDVVIDGELLFNGDYVDSGDQYRKTTKIVNSKLDDKKQITFNVFDIIPIDEFKKGESVSKYEHRRQVLSLMHETENIKVAPILYEGTDHSQIMVQHKKMVENGREGVMVNRNHVYQCKRTTSLLKVKVMDDVDLRVIGYEEGRGENIGRLGAFIVDYKGHKVNVGSGYSKEQRIEFWENRDKMIGKIIKVQHFEETCNQQGGLSLRFPVFLEVREDKNEPSYD